MCGGYQGRVRQQAGAAVGSTGAGGGLAVACHTRHGATRTTAAAISTPMGMESEISEAASSRGFDIPEYVEVTRLVTIRTILKALRTIRD